MKAKRSIPGVPEIDSGQTSTARPTVPVGAVLATEVVFQQLAYEAEVFSIVRTAGMWPDGTDRRYQ
jgi:hypothetical protein